MAVHQSTTPLSSRPPSTDTRLTTQFATRVGIYARVSTGNGQQDPEMQVRELREFAERRGWQVADVYTDAGISGSKDSRPALNRLMSDARQRRFDVIVVWRFDRFARSVSHLIRALETFNALGIDFISFSENIDTSTPTGKMIFTVLGAVAELERSLIIERVRAGIRNARAKGIRLGRPPVFTNVSKILELRQQGYSWSQITIETGVSKGTAQRALASLPKNPVESPAVTA